MSNFQINGIPFPSPVIKTRPDEVKPNTVLIAPFIEHFRRKFRSVIYSYRSR